jgi:polyphosphate kinase
MTPSQPLLLLDRDLSILAFNARVLDWARRPDVPVLERLRYLAIVSSNLDEFFEVRFAPQLTAFRTNDHRGAITVDSFLHVAKRVQELVDTQYSIYNDDLLPALREHHIRLMAHSERTPQQRRWVKDFFKAEVQPMLLPISLDPSHPFPQVANKSLNFIVRLQGHDAFGRENHIAIVKVPRSLPRYVRLPGPKGAKTQYVASISSIIRSHLSDLFPGRTVTDFSQFRVTRHSDLALDEEEVKNLRMAVRLGLQQRHYGQALRLEVSAGCAVDLADFLLQQFGLPVESLFRVAGPVNLVRLNQLIEMVDTPSLRFTPYQPGWPQALPPGQSYFEQLKAGDVMIHQPFESFDAVLGFLREAVEDPNVLSIKQTIYRAGSKGEMAELLREAVRRGKEVTAVVELKARFDEEANVGYAEKLEAAGVQVVYGVMGLKTHAKVLLVQRREQGQIVRYAHLSTGNYNPTTAKLYTDVSYLTANPELTAELEQLFWHLASQNRLPKLNHVLVAPFTLHQGMQERIEQTVAAAQAGQAAHIMLKMNSLTDEPLARALAYASQQGVQIDLIVRGACILPPGVSGQTDNIRVRSIIGRMLEHSRVFFFKAGDQEQLWLSSADWMNRNMLRRIELVWPVTDLKLKSRIMEECFHLYLQDTQDAWTLHSDGSYESVLPAKSRRSSPGPLSAQAQLMQRYGSTSPLA